MQWAANNTVFHWFRALIMILFATTIIVLLSRYKLVIVHGNSMHPTLTDGQLLIIHTNESKIEKGDIIVFEKEHIIYIKRVVATSGDRVEQNCSSDYLAVNGNCVIGCENELIEGNTISTLIPSASYFVIGDNYCDSIDSRSSKVGLVRQDEVVGVVRN